MSVDGVDGFVIVHTDVVRLDANQRAKFLVNLIHDEIAIATAADGKEPPIREGGGERCGDISNLPVSNKVGIQKVPKEAEYENDRRPVRIPEEKLCGCHCRMCGVRFRQYVDASDSSTTRAAVEGWVSRGSSRILVSWI